MKIKCPFCKTEYAAENVAGREVQCFCCGHVWTAPRRRQGGWLLALSALCALLAVAAFALAVVMIKSEKKIPMLIKLNPAMNGNLIAGTIVNQSDKIRGVPDLIAVMRDARGRVIRTEKITPSAPLLGAGESLDFSYAISDAGGAKKVSVEIAE